MPPLGVDVGVLVVKSTFLRLTETLTLAAVALALDTLMLAESILGVLAGVAEAVAVPVVVTVVVAVGVVVTVTVGD